MRYPDIDALRAAGYTVEERSPWHYQVMGKVIVNIWPSKKKYMVEYDRGASFYEDVVEAVDGILAEKESRRDFWNKEFEATYDWDLYEIFQAGIKAVRRKEIV